MSTLTVFLVAQAVMLLWMGGLYFVQRARRDAGIIDVGWTAGIAFCAIWMAVHSEGWVVRRFLVSALAGIWAARLCYYIVVDRLWGKEEDRRYSKLRAHWGARAELYFFITFVSQGVLILFFAAPLWVAMQVPADSLTIFDALAILLWLIAVVGETVSDQQLARFRAKPDNRGKTCRDGFWKYSRHPNYFFEWLHWWTYVAMAIGTPYAWITLVGPAVMFLFLFKITGIPYTEKQALSSRGDDYRDYQRSTSVFIPWFPKKGKA